MLRAVTLVVALYSSGCMGASVICPSSMSAGDTHTCFVAGLTPTALSSTTVKLVRKAGSEEVAGLPSGASPGLFSLALPANLPLGDYEAKAVSPGVLDQSVDVEVTAQAALVLLENDKALYKPGQTAKFRVLVVSLVQRLPLQGRSLQYAIVSPNGFKLLQGSATTDASGVAQFEFPIAAEPLQGAHTARASLVGASGAAASSEVGFSVEEYVLPRFEVNVSIDQSHLTASTWNSNDGDKTVDVTGRIVATYTYGKGVTGKATISAFKKLRHWEMPVIARVGGGSGEGGAPYQLVGTMEGVEVSSTSGATFTLPVRKDSLNAGDLTIEVAVVDSVTTERQNSTAQVPVVYPGHDLTVHLETVDGADVFKPGLPLMVRVELKQPSGAAATAAQIGSPIEVTLERHLVSWQEQQPDMTSVTLGSADFTGGVAIASLPVPLEASRCCNPASAPKTEDEYNAMMGCCTSRVSVQLKKDDQYVSSGSDPDMVSYLCLSRAYSPSGHFLSVNPPFPDAPVDVRSTMAWAELESAVDYMVLQGGAIASAGSATPTATAQHADGYWTAQLTVQVPAGIAGQCRIVIIGRTVAAGVAVTGSASFERGLEWPFTLSAHFSPQEVLPGSEVTVELEAGATSARAFLTSLDKSAELLGKRASISSEAVLSGLERAAQGSAESDVAPRLWKLCYLFGSNVHIAGELPAGLALSAVENAAAEPDGEDLDNTWGPSLGENCPRPISNGCSGFGGGGGWMMEDAEAMPMMQRSAAGSPPSDSGSASASSSSQTISVRRFFPETWLWQDLMLEDGSGFSNKTLTVTAPDTITTWSLETFAVTPSGIAAMRSQTPLKVFKPFFAEVRLPYSAIRGEELEVIIAVFNYAQGSDSLQANLVVKLPPQLQLTDDSETGLTQQLAVTEGSAAQTTLRVRPTEIGTFRFTVEVTAPGHSDALERPILVKPEGFTVTESQNIVLELKDSVATGRVDLPLPGNEVSGSARSSISVVGDMLGPTISGLDRLLRIPSGCGEQNMITLAPNVYVSKYLMSVSRLTPALQQRITKNMLVGYGRQLTYRHSDGSFSAFGEQDGEGSTWLTAFVLRVFAEVHATGLVAVDSAVLEAAATWLISLQKADGSFRNSGRVIHQEMMGGVSGLEDGFTALTSFVLAAIAKARTAVPSFSVSGIQDALDKAGQYLANKAVTLVYAKLLRIHALRAANLKPADDAADEVMQLSKLLAGGSERYWTAGSAAVTSGHGGHKTQDVELTGYAVLVLSDAGKLGDAFTGARWLLKRRTADGGFSSTQDTVVALNALATYAMAVAGTSSMRVNLTGGALAETLTVDPTNFDVMQIRDATPGVPVDVEATGEGQALVVASLTYNLPEKPIVPCYDVDVDWFRVGGTAADFGGVARGCVQPREDCQGKASEGMWIMSVGLFTGYSAPAQALKDLQKQRVISRYEIEDSRVELYFDGLPAGSCVEFNVTKDYDVRGLQAQPTEFYEYYAPEMAGSTLTGFQMKTYTAMPRAVSDSASSSWSFKISSLMFLALASLAV